MKENKFRTVFLSFFFFFQGVFLTGMILFVVFNNKVVPVMKEKNTEIELLLKEINKIDNRVHKHSEKSLNESINKLQYQDIYI